MNRLLNRQGNQRLLAACAISAALLLSPIPAMTDAGHSHDTESQRKKPKNTQFTGSFSPRVIKAAAPTLGQPALYGEWSDVESWPVIAVHANLMPNGKVLAWDATPDDLDDDPHTTDNYTTRVSLWDPVTNLHVATNNDTNADLFCAGSAQLWDGRVLFAGGDSGVAGENGPLPNTNIYDPETNTWRSVSEMVAPRWYASVAALGNGEMLTYAGLYDPVPFGEVFQLDETWRSLDLPVPAGISIDYQWMQSTPQGTVLSFGPQNTLTTIDPRGEGSLTLGPKRDDFPERRYGSYAMYDIGKVLVAGGTIKDGGAPSFSSSVVIDTATQQTTDTSPMAVGRTQHNLTILADGSVLATGGNWDGAPLVSEVAGIFTPEIWSPDSGQWRPMNDMQVDRQYHTVALLLPDGRVLSAGGGYCGTCDEIGYEEQNAEIFSPPYLFSSGDTPAVRPVISSAPGTMDYREAYSIGTDQLNRISKVHLIKLGAVTHSQNQDQRLVPLAFNRDGNTLRVTAPSDRHTAPPGYYMLIVVNDDGVPSVSKMVRVGQPLLNNGARVSNSLRMNESDEYVINADNSHKALLVTLSGQTSNLDLEITGVAANGESTASCSESGQNVECRLSNQSATRWKIKVNGNAQTPYNLRADLSEIEDPDAEQPSDDRIVAGGGGSFAVGGSFLLVLFSIWRRRRS